MIIRYSPGVRSEVGHYVGTIFNSFAGGWPGGVPTPGETQTLNVSSLTIASSGTFVFTTNYPASWTSSIGSIVAAANGLSATFTAPSGTTTGTVTATNLDNPGLVASASVNVTPGGPSSTGEVVGQDGTQASRGFIDA